MADVLNGTPSIVVGVFAWTWIVARQKHFSGFAGSVALAILMVPMVMRTTEEIIKLVPHSLREAALALGYQRWRTTLQIVLRTALPGHPHRRACSPWRASPARRRRCSSPRSAASTWAPTSTSRWPRCRSPSSPTRPARTRSGTGYAWAAALVLIILVFVLSMGARCATRRMASSVAEARGQCRRDGAAAPRGAPALETDKLSAMYGKFTAVKNVSLGFAANRVHALIGPSGCGKSTFLRTLNRMHEMSEGGWITGRVLLDGEDVYASRRQRRCSSGGGSAWCSRARRRSRPCRIFDNVAAGLRVSGRRPRVGAARTGASRRCAQAALWDEVKDRLHQSAMALSGGQQQRLCIARTIAPQPEVVLLDEPTSSLDPQGTQRIEELLFELKQEFTIVIVTHNMQQAARVSDTTTLLLPGRR